jgi:hypothetical protein
VYRRQPLARQESIETGLWIHNATEMRLLAVGCAAVAVEVDVINDGDRSRTRNGNARLLA